ncbi:2-keto-3-deoxygluconate permease [Rubrobacter taiwanensis]|uniref:2-keto-3-deoxygluconate permease n=1 Tax=Rubrobacter taiwanensis TaxID=185139 RepID=A0A4R1BG19_9ACTN|nr:2-keto-3-deoxygluconate permease [Rubrobacter taiwanensis]TCJ16129.1 2-keto-3-deoxygluconate permease [Rubrobacter taiwanensis]
MRILATVERIPGGLMIVPLLLGASLNTFFPEALEIGGFTTALFKEGALALIGAFLFCMGAQIPARAAGVPLEKGAAILLGKLAAGVAVGLAVAALMPDGTLLGLVPVAIIAAMTNSNGGLFVALTEEFGNETDTGAVSVISINDGPFFTLVALGVAGLADIPLLALVAVLVPILAGFVLGNLDEDIRNFLKPGQRLLIPFFAFPLGASIDFGTILTAGPPGILLGVMTVVISGFGAIAFLYGWYLIRRRPRRQRNVVSGAAEASTAGNAVATPAAVALADPAYEAVAEVATAQVAASTVTTAILTPVFVILIYRWQMSRGVDPRKEFEELIPGGSGRP